MTISVNWATQRITVEQSDLTFISGVLYELDVNDLRVALKDIEDNSDGMVFLDTHRHNSAVLLAGVTYVQTFEVINGYTIEFEDTGSPYTVRCINANHNLSDVFVPGTSQVSLIIGNSAGLVVASGGGGLSPAQEAMLIAIQKLLEADKVFVPSGGGAGTLHTYERGTTTPLIPSKAVTGSSQTSAAAIEEP